jgi:hypothetical protein
LIEGRPTLGDCRMATLQGKAASLRIAIARFPVFDELCQQSRYRCFASKLRCLLAGKVSFWRTQYHWRSVPKESCSANLDELDPSLPVN